MMNTFIRCYFINYGLSWDLLSLIDGVIFFNNNNNNNKQQIVKGQTLNPSKIGIMILC